MPLPRYIRAIQIFLGVAVCAVWGLCLTWALFQVELATVIQWISWSPFGR